MLGSIPESILRAYIRAYMAASIPSYAIWCFVESILRSVVENILGGIPANVLGEYLDAS